MPTSLPPALVPPTPGERRRRLAARVGSGVPLLLPGVSDPGGALLVEAAGFDAVYATGAGIANAQLGLPDIGLATQTEVAGQLERIVSATSLPVIADADTGYGGIPAVVRTVRLFEQAGAAGLQLEDQQFPKRCGHFDGHTLVGTAEMQAKIAAAVAARDDARLLLVARTDARGVLGLDEALRRGHAFLDAGADALFVEAPRGPDELARIGAEFAGVPLVANVVEGGKTPPLPLEQLHQLGFTIVLHANFLMRVMLAAGRDALAHLHASGETASYAERMLPWQDRQAMFRLPEFQQAESTLLAEWGADS